MAEKSSHTYVSGAIIEVWKPASGSRMSNLLFSYWQWPLLVNNKLQNVTTHLKQSCVLHKHSLNGLVLPGTFHPDRQKWKQVVQYEQLHTASHRWTESHDSPWSPAHVSDTSVYTEHHLEGRERHENRENNERQTEGEDVYWCTWAVADSRDPGVDWAGVWRHWQRLLVCSWALLRHELQLSRLAGLNKQQP